MLWKLFTFRLALTDMKHVYRTDYMFSQRIRTIKSKWRNNRGVIEGMYKNITNGQ